MTRPSPFKPLTIALACALLAGCNLAPHYQAPPLPVPETVAPPLRPGRRATDAVRWPTAGPMQWQDFVQEPRLRELVGLALEHNRDLRLALLAIDKARAQYGVAQADRFPTVNASGAGSRARTADDLTTPGRPNTTSQYSASWASASYEIDFFGRVRNLNDAALQEFLRVAENRRSVQLSLVAEVMGAWLLLDADARRLRWRARPCATRQQALDLTRRSHRAGRHLRPGPGPGPVQRRHRTRGCGRLRLAGGARPQCAGPAGGRPCPHALAAGQRDRRHFCLRHDGHRAPPRRPAPSADARHGAAGRARRPALQRPAAAPGPARGRACAARQLRQHWRGARGVLSGHHPHRLGGHGQQCAVGPVRRRQRHLELRAPAAPADL